MHHTPLLPPPFSTVCHATLIALVSDVHMFLQSLLWMCLWLLNEPCCFVWAPTWHCLVNHCSPASTPTYQTSAWNHWHIPFSQLGASWWPIVCFSTVNITTSLAMYELRGKCNPIHHDYYKSVTWWDRGSIWPVWDYSWDCYFSSFADQGSSNFWLPSASASQWREV